MNYLWAAVGWLLGSLLPAIETAYLAYKQGQNSEIIQQSKKQIDAAYHSNTQIAQAIELKQRLDAAGATGAERMRAWYAHYSAPGN